MNDGSVFERTELKYLLTQEQYAAILPKMREHLIMDRYGETSIRSLYYDTENLLLIRRSIERPFYKEKLRLRSYGVPASRDPVFLEIKKKYDGIVYKRRIALPYAKAEHFDTQGLLRSDQIAKEIAYFIQCYPTIAPRYLILYERTAYFGEIRVTFDRDIRFRTERLSLVSEGDGIPIRPDHILMELKIGEAMPLWLAHLLSEHQIYKTSFSKVGEAYTISHS
ncbi:MAG: polyphosphate polymerase domain-containing protein [Christensenellaceae bacterium]